MPLQTGSLQTGSLQTGSLQTGSLQTGQQYASSKGTAKRARGAPVFSNFANVHDFSAFNAFFGPRKDQTGEPTVSTNPTDFSAFNGPRKDQTGEPTVSTNPTENVSSNAAVFKNQSTPLFGDFTKPISLFGDVTDKGVDLGLLTSQNQRQSVLAKPKTTMFTQGLFGRYATGRGYV